MKNTLLFAALSGCSFLEAQSPLTLGDIQFVGFRSDAPDGFAFVYWKPLEPGTQILFTDNGWAAQDSTAFSHRTENTLVWTSSFSETLPAGTLVNVSCPGTQCSANYGSTLGHLSGLSTSGDQIFAFQGRLDSVNMLAGLNFNGQNWHHDRTNSSTSALPLKLWGTPYAVSVPHVDNAQFVGLREAHGIWEYSNWLSSAENSWMGENDGLLMGALNDEPFAQVETGIGPPVAFVDGIEVRYLARGSWRIDLNLSEFADADGILLQLHAWNSPAVPQDLMAYPQDADAEDGFATALVTVQNPAATFRNIAAGQRYRLSAYTYKLQNGFPIYNYRNAKHLSVFGIEEQASNQLLSWQQLEWQMNEEQPESHEALLSKEQMDSLLFEDAEGQLHYRPEPGGAFQLEVFDGQGRNIYRSNPDGPGTWDAAAYLKPGLYLAKWRKANGELIGIYKLIR